MRASTIRKLISGGQTGADRAALDVGLELGIPIGGSCPRGRRAEDGVVPERYPLRETASTSYSVRTEANVRDADATLILTRGRPDRGTALTRRIAERLGRPYLVVDLAEPVDPAELRAWLERERVLVLNVAGPRESWAPGIHGEVARFLRSALRDA